MKKRWIVLFVIMAVLAVAGLWAPGGSGFDLAAAVCGINTADTAWMLTATILVLMMTPGLSFFYGGMVREKNVISTMFQSFIAMGIISVLWVVFGFGLAFGEDVGGVIGNPLSFFMGNGIDGTNGADGSLAGLGLTIPVALYALFQMKFAILTPSLITGSFAERTRFSGYMIFMILFCIFIYCPLAHCTWHPDGLFASVMKVKDFAGGIVVHASSGVAALAGAIFLGKRKERADYRPANIPFVLLGAALLWLGWFGFNAGSSLHADGLAVKAFLNTNTASAAAMVTWLCFDVAMGRKPSAMGAAIGAVVGLVAITPSAGWVSVGESIFIGFVTTIICNIAVTWKNKKHVFDDALDVFPTHGIGGIVGTIMTGFFVYDAETGLTYWESVGNHVLAVLMVVVYTFVVAYALYWITNKMVTLRISEKSEKLGLDLTQHDEVFGTPLLSHELADSAPESEND